MKVAKEQEKKDENKKKSHTDSMDYDYALFDELRKLRLEIAKEERVPPYIVFSDKSLKDMSARKPKTRKEFLEVNGVGENKCNKYGTKFLEVIAKKSL